MNKAFLILALGGAAMLSSLAAKAEIVCTDGPNTVRISNDWKTATVSGPELEEPQVYGNLSELHGVLTAPGFAFYVRNAYGCWRDATVITAFRVFEGDDPNDAGYTGVRQFAVCGGGSTPDKICGFGHNQ
jgi:hypothetical protein